MNRFIALILSATVTITSMAQSGDNRKWKRIGPDCRTTFDYRKITR